MALETLQGFGEIGGFGIIQKAGDALACGTGREFVKIDHDTNEITFRIQNGPIGENGVNGCQVDTLIEAAKMIVHGLNKQFPCRENSLVITKLEEALHWSAARKKDREARGVEGQNKE